MSGMPGGWPVSLVAGAEPHGRPAVPQGSEAHAVPLVLRPLRMGDRSEWERLRRENLSYVGQWEPTAPDGVGRRVTYRQYVRNLDREAKSGRMLPFTIELDGRLVGQMHLFGIVQGSLMSGAAGYWVAQSDAGRGVATRALALMCDYAFGAAGLHRVEVNIRPENAASLRVVEHLRFRDEGVRERYLHISGAWRDHRTFALTREDLGPGSVLDRSKHP